MAHRTCSVPDCGRPHEGLGLCRRHRERLSRHGRLDRLTTTDRFWSHVRKSDGCWEWDKPNSAGYGRFMVRYRAYQAHRWAYEQFVGPIPDGLELDHLCRNRRCVRPDHLEPVTRRENLLRSPVTFAGRFAAQTHCKRGHPLSGPGSLLHPGPRGRRCGHCVDLLKRLKRAS